MLTSCYQRFEFYSDRFSLLIGSGQCANAAQDSSIVAVDGTKVVHPQSRTNRLHYDACRPLLSYWVNVGTCRSIRVSLPLANEARKQSAQDLTQACQALPGRVIRIQDVNESTEPCVHVSGGVQVACDVWIRLRNRCEGGLSKLETNCAGLRTHLETWKMGPTQEHSSK